MESGISDTVSYKITRQIVDHIYGSDQEMTDDDFMALFRTFHNLGGSWENLIGGAPADMDRLMDVIKAFVKVKNGNIG